MYRSDESDERKLLVGVLAKLLEVQADQLEAQVVASAVERVRSNVQNGLLPHEAATGLMWAALRRRIAARLLRREEARPYMRSLRGELMALEHGCSDLKLFVDVMQMGSAAAAHLDQEASPFQPQCFCEVVGNDAEQLREIVNRASGRLAVHLSAVGNDESYQRTIEALQRLRQELGPGVSDRRLLDDAEGDRD